MSSSRRREILLRALTNSPAPRTVDQLAVLVQSSPRTVRYDLDELAKWLARHQITLVRKPHLGVWLEGEPPALASIRPSGAELPAADDYLPSPQRQALGMTRLLLSSGPVGVAEFSSLLGVTRTTVYRELDRIGRWLAQRSLTLRRTRAASAVDGDEVCVRQALYELLREWVLEGDLSGSDELRAGSVGALMLRELGVTNPSCLRAAVGEAAEVATYPLTPAQTVGLLFWAAIVQARHRSGGVVQLPERITAKAEDLPEYRLALELLRRLNLPAQHHEAVFLAIHARGVRYGPTELKKLDLGLTRNRARELAVMFAGRASQLLGVELGGDEDLIRGLILHLEPALDRLELGVVAPNPLLDDIKLKYGGVYAIARQAAAMTEPLTGVLPEEEIGYLAMHLGAALERLSASTQDHIRTVLVCEHGVGTAQLLASLLASRLPELAVCGFASSHEVDQVAENCGAEVVITTRPLASARLPTFLVHPIPDVIELAALRSRLQSLRRAPRPGGAVGLGVIPGGASPLMLEHVLTSDTIALDVEAADWQEAIRQAGSLLVRTGAVRPEYIEGMIRAVLTIGPYVVVGPGIAMPHARPEDGALRVGLSCVRLASPVVFANKTENPVDLVFAFVAIDNQSHLTVMGQLARVLSNPTLVDQIRKARTVEDVLAVVHSVTAV